VQTDSDINGVKMVSIYLFEVFQTYPLPFSAPRLLTQISNLIIVECKMLQEFGFSTSAEEAAKALAHQIKGKTSTSSIQVNSFYRMLNITKSSSPVVQRAA